MAGRVKPLAGSWGGNEPVTATPLSFRLVERHEHYSIRSLRVKVKEYCSDIARDASISESNIKGRRATIDGRHTWRFQRRVTQKPGAASYALDIRGHFRSKGRAVVSLSLEELGNSENSQATPCSTGHMTFDVRHGG
jgi:hypothetical protein